MIHVRSRAFHRGFMSGFTSPFRVFQSPNFRYIRATATDEKAWKDVGDALRASYIQVSREIEQDTSKDAKRPAGKGRGTAGRP